MTDTNVSDRRQFWRKMIERQRTSGQSIVGFCAKVGLSTASFHAWKRRFRRPRRETQRKPAEQALVPVQIIGDPPAGGGMMEVQWPGGIVLRIQDCNTQAIGAVIAALSSASAPEARPC